MRASQGTRPHRTDAKSVHMYMLAGVTSVGVAFRVYTRSILCRGCSLVTAVVPSDLAMGLGSCLA